MTPSDLIFALPLTLFHHLRNRHSLVSEDDVQTDKRLIVGSFINQNTSRDAAGTRTGSHSVDDRCQAISFFKCQEKFFADLIGAGETSCQFSEAIFLGNRLISQSKT